MLDTNSQSQAARMTAEFVRVWAVAATTPALQTMRFWTQMLSPVPVTAAAASSEPEAPDETAEMPAPADTQDDCAEQPPAGETSATDPGFSSYRSSSGHAVAQVVIAEQE